MSLRAASPITAVGNTWNPNVQGADGAGHYVVGTLDGPVSAVNGNFSINNGWSLQR